MVFVDADFFIGLYLVFDPHHQTCLSISEGLTDDMVTSYDVIDEVVTKISYFKRKDQALVFLNDVKKLSIMLVYPNQDLFEKAKKIFRLQQISHVSFTDCMNMAIAGEWKIKQFLSFDRIYEKNGFELIK